MVAGLLGDLGQALVDLEGTERPGRELPERASQ